MLSSNKIVSISSRFVRIYLAALTAAIILSIAVASAYIDYISSVANTISHNAILLNDRFLLKQNLAPLLHGDLIGINIFNSKNQLIFAHELNENSLLSIEIPKCYYDRSTKLYCLKLKFSLKSILVFWLLTAVLLLFLIIPILKIEQRKLKNDLNAKMAAMVKKLAHDIRSPLSTLNIISDKIENNELKILQTAVVQQILSISENLLNYSKESKVINFNPHVESVDSTSKLVQSTYADFFKALQKEYQLKRNLTLRNINFEIDSALEGIASINLNILYPIICNIISNSVEATQPYTGTILITCILDDKHIMVTVEDDGHGIEKSILELIGKEEITTKADFKGSSGNGIGLFNAKKDLDLVGGKITIASQLNKFTKVTVLMPI